MQDTGAYTLECKGEPGLNDPCSSQIKVGSIGSALHSK